MYPTIYLYKKSYIMLLIDLGWAEQTNLHLQTLIHL